MQELFVAIPLINARLDFVTSNYIVPFINEFNQRYSLTDRMPG